MSEQDWHCLESEQLIRKLETSITGLSTQQSNQKLQQFGPNSVPETYHRSQ